MDEEIKKAEKKLEVIQNTPELKEMYDERFKQITDKKNRIKSAKAEGRNEGRIEGKEEERRITVKALIDMGIPLDTLEEKLGYDPKKYM